MSASERPSLELRHQALVEAFADFLWFCSPDGRLISDMPAWRSITGQTPEQLMGYGWLDGVHPDDRGRVIAGWEDAVARRAAWSSTYRLVAPGGAQRWLEVRGAPVVEHGELREWIGTAIDVTDREERRAVEQGLRASLARERDMFQHVIAQAPVAVAVLEGPEHRFRIFNQAYLDLAPAGRVHAGTTVAEAMPETRDNAVPLLDRCFAGETIEMTELAVPFDDERSFDGHRYYDFTYSPIREDGRSLGVLVTATEVTEKVRSRGDLTRRLEEEHRIATQLTRAMVPEQLPEVAGVDLAVRYLPAGARAGVGGDWYDVREVADGRVLLVMGDVCGKGLEAATAMSQMRSAVRAYALAEAEPAAILERASTYMEAFQVADMITMSVAVLDLGAGTLSLASAGHLPPLLVRAGQAPAFALVHADPPLGSGHAGYRAVTIPMSAGDRIALITDGAVELRDRSLADTLEDLRAAAERAAGDATDAGTLCTVLHDHVRATAVGADDAALLVCGVLRPGRRAEAAATGQAP